MNSTNNDKLRDFDHFLTGCHCDTFAILSLAESLHRSVKLTELENAVDCQDRILIQVLVERIKELNERIGDFL
jgi:hypothetical protein